MLEFLALIPLDESLEEGNAYDTFLALSQFH